MLIHIAAVAVTLAIQARANATPSIAAAQRFVSVVWGATSKEGATDVYAAVSRDGGRSFARAVRVNDGDGNASLGVEQPPRVSLVLRASGDPLMVVVWTAKSKDGTRLLVSRSENGGVSFSPAAPIHGSEAPGNRGWESTTVDGNGRVFALWLDHREMAAGSASEMHHEGHDHAAAGAPKADGAAHAQLSKLYVARLDDAASARALTGGVCYCCKTAIASGPGGALYAAWRHVYPGNIRDIAFTMSRDGGRTFAAPVRVSEDRWVLDGCPENGPALAVGTNNAVHVLWLTLVSGKTPDAEPTLALFYAATRDGRSFSPRRRVATDGVPRHAQLIATARGLVAAWDEETPGGGRRVVLDRDVNGTAREILSNARAQTPAIADVGDGVAIAWAEGSVSSVIRVERTAF